MKTNPTARDAERALLGGLLQSTDALGDVIAAVSPEDFHSPDHAALFRLVVAMRRKGEIVDIVTLPERIAQQGNQDAYGGIAYVVGLLDACPSTANLVHYARLIREAATRRHLAELGERIREQALAGELDSRAVLAQAQAAIARAEGGRQTIRPFHELFDATIARMQAKYEGSAPVAMSTGFPQLDDWHGGGLRPGELTIICARPGVGKTAVAMNLVVRIARQGNGVGVFSLEMHDEQLSDRIMAMAAGVQLDHVLAPKTLGATGWDDVVTAHESGRGLPILADFTPNLTAAQVESRARSMVASGARLIVVDYLGKMAVEGRHSPTVEVGRNVSAMKNLAKSLRVPVLLLAQLNRGAETRRDKRPVLADLRDSGEIEQEADSVLALHREAMHDETADPSALEIIIRKSRMGRLGTCSMRWDGGLQLVTDPWDVTL